ncbi:MAG: exosortase H-associated membrane protein [Pseudomonadota bacterium]
MRHNRQLKSFLVRVVLCLPACLALWYWQAEWFNTPAVILSGWTMQSMFPEWVEAIEWSHRTASLVTTLKVLGMTSGTTLGQQALMVVEVNPLGYTFGLPLFASLMLARSSKNQLWKFLLGAALLIPFQSWGICFDLLKQVAITSDRDIAEQVGFAGWHNEAIALGYQLGSLILPTLAPVIIWLSLDRTFIPMLMLEGELQSLLNPDGISTLEVTSEVTSQITSQITSQKIPGFDSVQK